MSVRIKGTINLQEVDANGNALVNLPLEGTQAGFSTMIAQNDAGDVTGTRSMKEVEISSDYRVRTGQDNMIFNEQFPGAAFNTALWQQTVGTATMSVTAGFANLNATFSVASGAFALLRTYRHFPCYKQYTTYAEMEVQFTEFPVTNNRCEWGLVLMASTAVPTDGAFFRIDAAGQFRAVISYNGTESQSAPLDFATLVGINDTHSFLIYIGSTTVLFWIDNILVAEIPVPAGQGSSMSSMNLPLAFRNHNVAATSVAQVMKVGNTNVSFGDQAMSKPWGHVLSGAGAFSAQGQTGGTMGSTSIYTNAAAAAAAALSNTAAAAQNTGLGGIINVLPTLAAGTDGILCSFQVPLGTAALPGKSLYITGVALDSVVSTALVGGPVIYAASVAFGHTAVSLATTETAATKAPRRVALGIQSFAATAAVGVQPQKLQDDYTVAPVCIQPGEFVQLVLRNIGTVTTSGAITFVVSFTGYWE
jgi:hypothetical protein